MPLQIETWIADFDDIESDFTFANYVKHLRAFLGWAVEEKIIRENPPADSRVVAMAWVKSASYFPGPPKPGPALRALQRGLNPVWELDVFCSAEAGGVLVHATLHLPEEAAAEKVLRAGQREIPPGDFRCTG